MTVEGKPSVLLVGNFLPSAVGSRGVCEELAARLSRLGWTVCTTSSKPARLLRLIDMVSTVWRRRRRYHVAHVDVFSGPAFLWAEAVCGVMMVVGKPFVLTLHGGNLPRFANEWPRRVRRLLGSAAVVTTTSRYLLEQMAPYRADLRLVPNALDINTYEFRPRARPRPSLVWMRAFHAIYNPTLAPRVLALLRDEFPRTNLAMTGPDKRDGSLRKVRRVVTQLGVGDGVSFPGWVPKSEVPHRLNEGDIFLNTTNVDNTPVSVLEAMACGLCVVSTNVGGLPSLLENEHDALLVGPDDPAGMAAAVRRVLTEPDLAARLSRNARRKAEQFDWSAVLPQWGSLLAAAANGRIQ